MACKCKFADFFPTRVRIYISNHCLNTKIIFHNYYFWVNFFCFFLLFHSRNTDLWSRFFSKFEKNLKYYLRTKNYRAWGTRKKSFWWEKLKNARESEWVSKHEYVNKRERERRRKKGEKRLNDKNAKAIGKPKKGI